MGHSYVSNLNSIYLVHNKIFKIICNIPNDFSTVSLFNENRILSLFDIFKYNTCIYMYQIFYKLYHPSIIHHFTLTTKKDLIPGVTVIFFNLILNIII